MFYFYEQYNLSGNDFFYTDNIAATPGNVKFAGKVKFEPKVLMWIAIWSEGLSTPYREISLTSSIHPLAIRHENIPFVPKDDNPPNGPQARAIERFWADP